MKKTSLLIIMIFAFISTFVGGTYFFTTVIPYFIDMIETAINGDGGSISIVANAQEWYWSASLIVINTVIFAFGFIYMLETIGKESETEILKVWVVILSLMNIFALPLFVISLIEYIKAVKSE